MTSGAAIRSALRQGYLRRLGGRPDTLVVDELGLVHARSRVDVAVINGHVHGYEIKGASDSLRRLPRQLEVYRQALQTLTLVVDRRHLSTVAEKVPDWCGILVVGFGPRGGAHFSRIRRTRKNPGLDPFKLAHLLWRCEAREALAERGASKRDLRAPRRQLYRLLVEQVTVSELTALIRESMIRREGWRGHARPS